MLRMLRAVAGAVALAATLFAAGCAAAEESDPGREHTIIILSGTYFPETTYAAEGDRLRFVNESALEQIVMAPEAGWTTGIIEPGQELVIPVTSSMQGSFFGDKARSIEGHLSFAPSPLEN